MIKALKIIFFFQKPDGDNQRLPYIIFGIIGWLEIISILITLIRWKKRKAAVKEKELKLLEQLKKKYEKNSWKDS